MSNPVTIGNAELWLGDCRDILPTLGKVDAVICDLPYGTTQNKWDCPLPLDELWREYRRVCSGAVILTAAQPFTARLVASNESGFRYSWVWHKSRPTGFLNAKLQPLRAHEDICVFYDAQPIYNPQYGFGAPNHVSKSGKPRTKGRSENYGAQYEIVEEDTERKYPTTVLSFPAISPTDVLHPTQKPVGLMEYMARTYTDFGGVILDNCMGSGTTGVAAVQMGRKFIGIEREPKYFDIACKRIEEAQRQGDMFINGAAV
ncbi:DNA-methyltransferase [Sphingobium fluviale]|uniref:Methyltransferase n=1 Tax=Sphingobium fluviale TaxID=2506423 RepID=A0A4Q1KGU3_9SPHN|nr:site-specific DNA-methyltransferase [Sphingobium fluviale]RXR28938.1 site-specific DNA-methyltransferase [Sphingobium fluviale]